MSTRARRYAPATVRNRAPISQAIKHEIPQSGTVLEIASGTGEHATYLAGCYPNLDWQPSDRTQTALDSIAAWRRNYIGKNLCAPILLDANSNHWPPGPFAAILCINMVHISPWDATVGLLSGASRLLGAGAPLILYGAYLEDGVETAPSNLAFDESLKSRDPRWGLRNVADIDALARSSGFERTARHVMPANNLTLVYRNRA